MKKSLIIAAALILGICIATATAVDVTRFGPKQYVREKGKPQTVTDTFAAYACPGQIIVENGDGDGDHRVSSAIIKLNGEVIFGPHDFNRHCKKPKRPPHHRWYKHSHHAPGHKKHGPKPPPYPCEYLEAVVDLVESNTLSVKLLGKPGSYLTITVIQAVEPPTAGITADPDSIFLGESATLNWTSTNADQVTIDQGIGAVDPIGSLTITPEETTTYTITAANDGGQAQASVTVTVTNPVPTVEISADPTSIVKGGSTTLTWTSISSQSASIDNEIGVVSLSGSTTVSPTHTTTYTITVSGPLGVASAQATVMVTTEIEPQPEGSFGEQYEDLIPPDSSIESYDARRFSVITGLVTDQGGVPIPDVAVTILHHPEYGTAYTDGEGRYSIPAEGGAVMTVACAKEGLINAHRKVQVPWNDIAIVETMVMIPQDTKATTVTFDGDPNTVITHQSTEVSDEWGTRSCTTVFTGDNTAYLVDEEGNTLQELTTITTRATEFTTPESMPAKLPPTSAYTYCVELTVDGAERVRFEKPIYMWVDNFLAFDVGVPVPVGIYDRDQGVWVPEKDGVVVKLLDTNNDTIVDALDATGDDLPDDLNSNGSFSDEVQGLSDSQQYQAGATFWRVALKHFSPCDPNFPWGPLPDAIAPNPPETALTDFQGEHCGTTPTSSYIKHKSRTFHEDIPIPGTDISLHYTSSRTDGYHQVITVPASGDTVPASLKRIIVQFIVAGRIHEQVLDPLPDQKAEFKWDGLDHLDRPVEGSIRAYAKVAFVYDGYYYVPGGSLSSFALPGITPSGVRMRDEIYFWQETSLVLHRGGDALADGWTISPHHHLSSMDPTTLHKGDGTIIQNNNVLMIDTIAGSGPPGRYGGFSGDGGLAVNARLDCPFGMAVDAEGNLYIADQRNHRIRKVDTNGIITTVAGSGCTGLYCGGYRGDGGPATEALLYRPEGVALDAQGNLFIADDANSCIRKVDTNGIITTVAGIGGRTGFSGDGGPATQALLTFPRDVAVDAQGNLYIADSVNGRLRKVDTNGIITTIAGGGNSGADGIPAIESYLSHFDSIALDSAGNIYIADTGNDRVRKIDNSGIITTVAGNGTGGYSGDGGPATQAQLNSPQGVAVDSAGNMYIGDAMNYRIRKVDTSGIITTVAGNGTQGFSGDNGPATLAQLSSYATGGMYLKVAVDVQGNIYIADKTNQRIRKVGLPAVFARYTALGDFAFTEENGLGYILNSAGRHKQTIDLDTGKVLYEFGYDEENRLVSITDRFGNQTTITRDGSGVPFSITSPDGITTYLTIDGNNHLTAINYPDGSTYNFEYTSDGLMTAKTDPEGNRFEHIFNATGRITDALDEEGGHWQFSRQTYANGDILSEVLSAEGNQTSYLDHTYSTGAFTSTTTDPTGAQMHYALSADELSVNKSLPCGMEYAFQYDVDREYGFKYVKGMWEDTPAGLERVTLRVKTYQDTNSDEIPDRITETLKVNDKTTTLVNDTLASTRTLTSPMGRTVTTLYDPDTLLTSTLSIPGLFDTGYGYDAKGRLTSITTNTRETSFTYNSQGFLESIIDPENHTTSYAYDAVGRMTGIFRPDGSSIGFDYDQNGNMTVLTTPSSIDHGFGYNRVNRNTSYLAPISGQYSYVYDRDRRLTQINFPSGLQISNVYSNGTLTQIQAPEGNIDFTYYCANMVESITKGAEGIVYGYDGQLVTSETLRGTLNQTLGYTYNNDFDLTAFTYAGSTSSYSYDNDGLLTGSGTFTITRDTANGLPTAVTGGALSLTRAFNGYGEVEGQDFNIGGSSLTSWSLTKDDAGRITQKQETVDGVTFTYEYTYDPMGRLLTVTKDGALVEEYHYGPNGARSSEMNSLRGITSRSMSYSDEDHLLTAGSTTYQYDADGFLVTKTKGTEVTQYSYSSRGELLQVTLPDATVIDYIHDPFGRRVAKIVNGVVVEKYLWQGQTRLLAIYNGNNNLLMRFEYADSRMPFALSSGGSTYYLTYDQVGSLRVVADVSGNVVKRIEYDSFGYIISDTNPAFEVPFRFAGGLFDKDTSLIRFGFRDYDPDIGRWTAKEPLIFKAGDTDLYGYCLSNPISCIDPLGLDFWVYNYPEKGRGYGHTGMIMPNDDGTYTRYSQGADDPNAPWYELVVPLHDVVVHKKEMSSPCMPGAQMVMIPTEHNDQVQKAINDYIEADWPYNVITNNCADFVNDVANAAEDINLSDRTIPNKYFDQLLKKYGPYKCNPGRE